MVESPLVHSEPTNPTAEHILKLLTDFPSEMDADSREIKEDSKRVESDLEVSIKILRKNWTIKRICSANRTLLFIFFQL